MEDKQLVDTLSQPKQQERLSGDDLMVLILAELCKINATLAGSSRVVVQVDGRQIADSMAGVVKYGV